MREIKFRAWDKDNKTMKTPDSIHWTGGEIDIVRVEEQQGVSENGVIFRKLIPIKDYILMQYTGLEDRNGKAIYEGDIIGNPITVEKYQVKYSQDRFVISSLFDSMTTQRDGFYDLFQGCSNLEVIGNIYENKELLKEV